MNIAKRRRLEDLQFWAWENLPASSFYPGERLSRWGLTRRLAPVDVAAMLTRTQKALLASLVDGPVRLRSHGQATYMQRTLAANGLLAIDYAWRENRYGGEDIVRVAELTARGRSVLMWS